MSHLKIFILVWFGTNLEPPQLNFQDHMFVYITPFFHHETQDSDHVAPIQARTRTRPA